MEKEHAMALAAEVAVMVANSHCDAENDQEHHAAIEATIAARRRPERDDRRQQMNELVEAGLWSLRDANERHSRSPHASTPALKKIAENQMVHGLAVKGQMTTSSCPCTTCQLVSASTRI